MSTKVETQSYRLDPLKWIIVTILVVAGVAGNWYLASIDISIFYRVVGLLVLAALAIFIGLKTQKGQIFFGLLKSARAEIRKVVWPTRQETKQTTLIVVVVVIITALILWGLDTLFGWLVSLIVG
ncbi:preprotein translocase subunit SecE [Entomomonas sp. E2T0]|uniref:preprotein translocase subunit SecE n=1 Tax=Entomomonas sp. E2T0 TaxID=2930213 RepID=UPI00222833FB|nr:preprotein translocase subunit SecE [Entomomonas sp. E2T0]UYZ85036.1 preprotein translocase subunit SecE [Entomomonas sp. E2T0]